MLDRIVQLNSISILTVVELEMLALYLSTGGQAGRKLPCSTHGTHTHYTATTHKCQEEVDVYIKHGIVHEKWEQLHI